MSQGFILPVLLGHFSGSWTRQHIRNDFILIIYIFLLLMVVFSLIKVNIVKPLNH